MSDTTYSHDSYDAEVAKAKEKVERYIEYYKLGKPLFPRSLLEDLDQQIASEKDPVYIPGFDDVPRKYSLKVPDYLAGSADSYNIRYVSIQSLTMSNPSYPDSVLIDRDPVAISYTDKAQKELQWPMRPRAEVESMFESNLQTWQTSDTCMSLKDSLATANFSTCIDKIVCFALGSLGRSNDRSITRSHMQHAAALTMAKVLREKSGSDVRCYAQDPGYSEVDKEILGSVGITVIEDPKGFIIVNEETLVFSVSPNVPVKQIIADAPWPAAMLWDTVTLEPEAKREWKYRDIDGHKVWVSPFSTDPDSSRVRDMVQHYSHSPFQDIEDHFGRLTMYNRK